jgi:low affinity Fe/Cu permease
MPSTVTGNLPIFDRFATHTSAWVSRGWFFALCVLIVVVWLPTIWVFPTFDTWQLVINTATTIITFLLVALLQNTQSRSDKATQHKLNAIAAALADLMGELAHERPQLSHHRTELVAAVGLEQRETSAQ